jgi:hypothetical protein
MQKNNGGMGANYSCRIPRKIKMGIKIKKTSFSLAVHSPSG